MAAHLWQFLQAHRMVSYSKLFGLDHLRALAIILVFVYHYGILFNGPPALRTFGKFGWTGVDLFFVLSGYLIASHLFLELSKTGTISLKTFFLKRTLRIFPAYYFVVALYFLFPFIREREGPAPLWKYLSFTHNYGLNLSQYRTFSHAWSLCIEEQFYLLLPFIVLGLFYFKIKRKYLYIIGFFIFGFFIRSWSWLHLVPLNEDGDPSPFLWHMWVYYPTYTRLDGLLTGVSVAAAFQYLPALKVKLIPYKNWLLLSGLLILTAGYFITEEETSYTASVYGFPIVDIGYGFLVMGAVLPGSILYRFKSGITTKLAELSYAVYLTHKFGNNITQKFFVQFDIPKNSWLMFLICTISCLLIAVMLHLMIEKPFMKLRDHLLRRNNDKFETVRLSS